jgi:hypothetical protein
MDRALKPTEPELVFGRTDNLHQQLMESLSTDDSIAMRNQLKEMDTFTFDMLFPGDKERQELGAKILESGDPESIRLASEHEDVFSQQQLNDTLFAAVKADDPQLTAALIQSGANAEAFGDQLERMIDQSENPAMKAAIKGQDESQWEDPGNVIKDVSENPYYSAAVQKTGETYYERGQTPFDINIHRLAGIDKGQPMSVESFTHLPMDTQKLASYLTNPGSQITADALY